VCKRDGRTSQRVASQNAEILVCLRPPWIWGICVRCTVAAEPDAQRMRWGVSRTSFTTTSNLCVYSTFETRQGKNLVVCCASFPLHLRAETRCVAVFFDTGRETSFSLSIVSEVRGARYRDRCCMYLCVCIHLHRTSCF
jgi:hypothetical protein